ncbi:MAG TPA: Fis family transcriptional regulator [Thermoanaerobaculia bacterium]|nr:Fis family transcriptional regulator [Thermoanaerobaculia bacterium]
MSHEVFTQDWAVAWGEAIRASDAYRTAAQRWQWPMVIIMTFDPELGLPERSIFLDLFEGDCREARSATETDRAAVPYILSGDFGTWKQVLERELDPILALMTVKLKLAKGSIAALLPYVTAARELVATAAQVPYRFPDGV